jgi:hypothetical protein
VGEVRIVCRPLTRWPSELRTAGQRCASPFSAPWSDTREQLAREARLIGGRELVIQLAISEVDIRRDGWPYAAARPNHPGITVVVADSDYGRLSWATDRYASWQANTRAVALSMEALRSADRHGVIQGRQYAGFRELPADGQRQPMGVQTAALLIARTAGWRGPDIPSSIIHNPDVREKAYREAAKRAHPDSGGDTDAFRGLKQAKDVLDEHGGGS